MSELVWVGTGLTENYIGKAGRFSYLESLDFLGSQPRVHAFTVLSDFPEAKARQMASEFRNIKFLTLSSSAVPGANPNHCLQHGAFLEPLGHHLAPDDYLIFTDADITIQRHFDDEEIDALGDVLVGSNWFDGETLAEEASALQPRLPWSEIEGLFPGCQALQCFNTGVLGATKNDWQRLFHHYVNCQQLVAQCFSHYARQQWLLSYVLQTCGFPLFKPDSDFVRTIHAHGHGPYRAERLEASGISIHDGLVWKGRKPVVFAHNLPL